MGADRDYDARVAAAAKSVNTGAFTELPSYTQQTGRDVPTNTSISNQSQSTPFGQAGSAPVAAGSEYQSVINDVNKTIKDAEKTLALAKKSGNKKDIAAAKSLVDLSKGQLSDLVKLVGSLGGDAGGTGAFAGNSSDSSYVSRGASGTSNTGKNYINGKLATPEEWSKFLYGDQKGGGATGTGTSTADADAREKRQSAFDLLKLQFDEYGLGALVEPLRGLIQEGISPSEFAVRLRQTDPYKKRFAANAARISKGLRALSEAEYINLEDGYQTIMRNYGLPASYYTKGELGRQEGFEKFIAGDVSPAELEDRISIAQKRVINAAPEVTQALKQFYPDIKNADILAYTLDPTQGLASIQKKVLAAEIGGAALGAKTVSGMALETSAARAEELARYGVTGESAKQGYAAIGGGLERGRQLSSIYQQPDYNQAVAEEEIFNLPGQTQAGEKRKKIVGLEKATFGGQTGVSSGALSQNRAGSY
jgi:hypothetical protein